MPVRKLQSIFSTYIITIIYAGILLCTTVYAVKRPAYNWDMLPYMGVILYYDGGSADNIHRQVFSIAKDQLPVVYYNRMIDPQNNYRNSTAQSPALFYSQLPFYTVKPLYTRIAWLFYKAGTALPAATIFPSAIAYFLTGLLLLTWFKKYWPPLLAGMGALLGMLSPPLLTVAGLSTPDAVSGCLLFAALFYMVEKKSITITVSLLLLAVFARLDNILPALCFLTIICFTNKWIYKPSAGKAALYFGCLLVACLAVSATTRPFGWNIMFYPAFIKQLNLSYTVKDSFDPGAWLLLLKAQITTGLYFSCVSFFLFLVLILLSNSGRFSFSLLTLEQVLAISFIIIITVRSLLQPLITDRIYIPYYLAAACFLVKQHAMVINHKYLHT